MLREYLLMAEETEPIPRIAPVRPLRMYFR